MSQYTKQQPETIQAMFNNISAQYDKTNAVMSLNMHKKWNRTLVEKIFVQTQPKAILDLCCGTGAIAFGYLKKATYPVTAFLLDFSEGMLECAKKLAKKQSLGRHDITYLKADAQQIPLTSSSIDCASIAYGIRNLKEPEKCIQEAFRVLKPGGTFGILELTKPKNTLLKLGHSIYLRCILPIVGKALTSNKEAYTYLCNSINTFVPPEHLEKLLREAGFINITTTPLSGGIATILVGKKPH